MSVQISAYIEEDIKKRMERYSETHGVKKGFLIQSALESYLNTLHEIPPGEILPGHFTVDEATMESLLDRENEEPHTKLKALFAED